MHKPDVNRLRQIRRNSCFKRLGKRLLGPTDPRSPDWGKSVLELLEDRFPFDYPAESAWWAPPPAPPPQRKVCICQQQQRDRRNCAACMKGTK